MVFSYLHFNKVLSESFDSWICRLDCIESLLFIVNSQFHKSKTQQQLQSEVREQTAL